MNDEILEKAVILPPFKHMIMTIGELPSSYVETMTYYEMLVWFTNYLGKTVIPAINENGEAVIELQDLFVKLQTYVNDYFDNLDVQEEINNKLDDMAESGQLTDIIAQYLGLAGMIAFDTVADMKTAQNLVNGSKCRTLGYYAVNDGGSSTYKIRQITNDDVVDEQFIIALYDNSLIAELILENEINVKQLGIHEDDTNDDSDLFQNAFNFLNNHKEITLKGNEKYCKITKTLNVFVYSKLKDIWFNMYEGTYTNNYLMYVNSNSSHNGWLITYPLYEGIIKNCSFKNNTNNNYNGIFNYSNGVFEDLTFNKFNVALKSSNNYLDGYKLARITTFNKIGTDYTIDLGYLGDQVVIDTLHLQGQGNHLNVGQGHNSIILNNIIAHGVININGSIVEFNNLHQETNGAKIVINNSIVSINNGFVYHNTNASEHNIEITNKSYVTLKNIKFNYVMDSTETVDNSTDDYDINISNSRCRVINCFKRVLVSDISENSLCVAKTNISLSLNNDQEYTTQDYIVTNYETNQNYVAHGGYYSGASTKVKWKLSSGTYYYIFQPIADFNRMIKYNNYARNYNAAVTQNGNGFIASLDVGKYRVYRGTSDGSYDKYVDICAAGGSVYDDGLTLSGNLWKSREAGAIDSFNSLTQTMYEGNNVRYFQTSAPTIGYWNRGDIVYNTTNDGATGWICTTAGSPGTWKEI